MHGRGDINNFGLTEEQRRRLFNAAALLQLLEAHLRDELMALESAGREPDNSKQSNVLTGLEKHSFLKNAAIDTDSICSQPSCPICGEDFAVDEIATQIQCSHFFHEGCVIPWLELQHNCPICRLEISDKYPSQEDLEKLTATEIRQRVQWHGHKPSPTADK